MLVWGCAALCLGGPKESKLRKERNEARPPDPPEAEEFGPVVGCVGEPLTAGCRVGGTKPRYGVDKEVGRVLSEGRGAMIGIWDCGILDRVSDGSLPMWNPGRVYPCRDVEYRAL